MDAQQAAVFALVIGAFMGLIKIIERQVDKRNGNRSLLTSDERKTLYDTGRCAKDIVEISKNQTKILSGIDRRTAVMDERTRR